jgi:hypothetical protein
MSNPTINLSDLRGLLSAPEVPDLGPRQRAGVKSAAELDKLLRAVLADGGVRSGLIHSALLLWHDHLDESHSLSQSIENPTGSFLHGIMHRREPDYGNSKYWFRRVGRHPAFSKIASRVGELLAKSGDQSLAAQLVPRGEWDAFAFVDVCETAAKLPADHPRRKLLRDIQQIEFEALLEFICAAEARLA